MIQSKRLFQAHGIATTRQRTLILKSMRDRRDHPDAETVFATLHAGMPTLSLDTVYRSLKLLARAGLIQQLALPTHRFHFDGCVVPHDHFLCTTCEKIVDLEAADGHPAALPEPRRKIGVVHAVQRVFLGTCRQCGDGSSRARGVGVRRSAAAGSGRGQPRGTRRGVGTRVPGKTRASVNDQKG